MDAAARPLLDRLRRLPPTRQDALLAAAFAVEGAAEVVLLTPLAGLRLLAGLGVIGGVAAAVGLRRRLPLTATTLMVSLMGVGRLLGPEIDENAVSPHFAWLLVLFTAGYCLDARRALACVGVAVVVSVAGITSTDAAASVNDALVGIAGPLLLGQLLRNRTGLNQALREKAARLEQERAEEAESAALAERTRIAGELHDVVAHALSAMTIQAGAARRLAAADPDRARAAFATAEVTGREALTELRRLLGVLRKQDEDLALAPQPQLAYLDDLVRRAAAAGLPVELRVEGERRPLPAGVDLTAFRLVQEALAAAQDGGAAGRAAVAIRYGDADVRVEIADDGGVRGRRLLGMRERVDVYGGELASAPLPDGGGWRVAARLPLEAAR